jgi:hypothetical protein
LTVVSEKKFKDGDDYVAMVETSGAAERDFDRSGAQLSTAYQPLARTQLSVYAQLQ